MLCCSPSFCFAQALTDQQIVDRIIQDSRNAYYATGHPCACPYDTARNSSACGARSAYSRPGGAEPKCYPKDVTKSEIEAYRAQQRQNDGHRQFWRRYYPARGMTVSYVNARQR
jgi:hypothetical protein